MEAQVLVLLRCLLVFVLLLAAGCDTQVWDFDAGASSGGRGGRTDAAPTCEADVCVCAAEQLLCGAACVDPGNDDLHCGACDKPCGEGERCRESRCECGPQQTRCAGICVNLQINPLHCGACNQPCPGNQPCQGGRCM